jgi:hypothetical protein
VRHNDGRAARHQTAERVENQAFRMCIEPGGWLIQNENRRIADDRSRDRMEMTLRARRIFPTNKVTLDRYTLISRRIRWSEWLTGIEQMDSLGMDEGWMQDFDSAAEYYRPDFGNAKVPFRDINDFTHR